MKVEKEVWEEKMNNLHTRTKGITSEHQIPYKDLLKKVYIGPVVLDVGCGTCWLKDLLPKETFYYGMDPFASAKQVLDGVIKWEIEDIKDSDFVDSAYTVFVFAALDGMRDLDKAFENLKRIAYKNIVILTGINIPPDQYHTHLITLDYIRQQMVGWKETVNIEVLKDKIVFLEYIK